MPLTALKVTGPRPSGNLAPWNRTSLIVRDSTSIEIVFDGRLRHEEQPRAQTTASPDVTRRIFKPSPQPHEGIVRQGHHLTLTRQNPLLDVLELHLVFIGEAVSFHENLGCQFDPTGNEVTLFLIETLYYL